MQSLTVAVRPLADRSGHAIAALRVALARALIAFALVVALSACAGIPVAGTTPPTGNDFELTGRFAARQGDEAGGGRITWRHTRAEDDLFVASPLGQGLARITRRDGLYVLETADERRLESLDPAELSERALGFAIPVAGLADWVQGRPIPGRAAEVERDGEGRVRSIRQDGWRIEVTAWAGDLPQRLRVERADFELRLSVDAWKPAN
jgi:outer membrane lipoprotein LolB